MILCLIGYKWKTVAAWSSRQHSSKFLNHNNVVCKMATCKANVIDWFSYHMEMNGNQWLLGAVDTIQHIHVFQTQQQGLQKIFLWHGKDGNQKSPKTVYCAFENGQKKMSSIHDLMLKKCILLAIVWMFWDGYCKSFLNSSYFRDNFTNCEQQCKTDTQKFDFTFGDTIVSEVTYHTRTHPNNPNPSIHSITKLVIIPLESETKFCNVIMHLK